MPLIAPSMLASDFLHLEDACQLVNESDADWFHLDVMDGHFVPNISFGIPIIEAIRKVATKTCDVHLMIEEPEKLTPAFARAGADQLSVHLETCRNLKTNIDQIKSLGMKAGVAISPHTPVSLLNEVLEHINHVCLMSVNPGFGGQHFLPHSMEKIRDLKKMIREKGLSVLIEVDGGVTPENAHRILQAGADVLVAGSAVFKSKDPKAVIRLLKQMT